MTIFALSEEKEIFSEVFSWEIDWKLWQGTLEESVNFLLRLKACFE